jgi:hypothetical protein
LYGGEVWPLTLREQHRLRVFDKRVLRRIFGPERNGLRDKGKSYSCNRPWRPIRF